ncbi:hypothetical protein HHK36_014457 [Tetracentron sinense]|uniref:SAC domain-containing protein n=1 Tax=Tetracentron sinense TaxID=13715 RepID=A0A834Z9R7_TETSI|nr:hypothetical protein HHK36_014457 [Tetracentron sinense]
MTSKNEQQAGIQEEPDPTCGYLQKFRLYETRSKFYLIGRGKSRTLWRVLKIDRLEPSDLNIFEDSTTYSESDCYDLLKRIHEGNRSTGGLKFVTTCYGIIGFIKFLGPYYMLLITKRRQIGAICGHAVYSITKTKMIPLPNSTAQSNMAYSKNENRSFVHSACKCIMSTVLLKETLEISIQYYALSLYKKLLCTVDLTKDFFFSYSYHIMRSLQKNLCASETGQVLYETMFVWNEYMTRGIRNHLKNTLWTVALVYGFFKQIDSGNGDGKIIPPHQIRSDASSTKSPGVKIRPKQPVPLFQQRSIKLEFPMFDGNDPISWLVCAERYMRFYNIPKKQRVDMAAFLLEGEAFRYFEWMQYMVGVIPWMASRMLYYLDLDPLLMKITLVNPPSFAKWVLSATTKLHLSVCPTTQGVTQTNLVKLSISERDFKLTLIARRSRHFAGTRYLKRGVNEKGRVANDVETEQIVFEDVPEGCPTQISSVVQIRGSIPLFWSQETSRLNIKPDIILSKKDQNYEATRIHFENLVKRYGNPIIILNLIKTHEKKPRESILRAEFANAIEFINKDLPEENRLKFLHWDLHKHSRRKATNVLALLGKVAAYALNLTNIFYFQVTTASRHDESLKWSYFKYGNQWARTDNAVKNHWNSTLKRKQREEPNGGDDDGRSARNNDADDSSPQNHCNYDSEDAGNLETKLSEDNSDVNGNHFIKPPMYQKGVLRTNCIDCLDRTNVAQYAYGLAALRHQLHALGFVDVPKIDLDAPLADDLMRIYETMGDTLALQYGGSAAHNKIFSERRGQWKAAVQSQEFIRTLQRYYSNAYMDAEKQDAINVFLGHFQPQQGKPALWELDSDQHYNVGRRGHTFVDENARSFFKRSLSDGNILCESSSPISSTIVDQKKLPNSGMPDRTHGGGGKGLSESTPDVSTCDSDISCSRYTPSMDRKQLFPDMQRDHYLQSDQIYLNEHGDAFNCSNFVDLDWLSSSGNSCEEEIYERSALINSPTAGLSSENVADGITDETTPSASEYGSSMKGREQTETQLSDIPWNTDVGNFADSFVQWVTDGDTLFW